MKSFIDIDHTFGGQPPRLGVRLARIDQGRGQEALFEDQLPELLRALSEDARVASITASNAIEGVQLDERRAGQVAGGSRFRNRNEREFAGYRDALDALMRDPVEPVSVSMVLRLHREIFSHVDARGGCFKTDDNQIVSYEDGRRHVIFEPVSAAETPFMTQELIDRYLQAQTEQVAHPLLLVAALILDFLAIHPVADGNGRVARLLTTNELLGRGYSVPRYVSLEQQIFETKHGYYAALADSQRGWHEASHTIWPWAEYLVDALGATYDRFEQRVAARRGEPGDNKQARVRNYVLDHAPDRFAIADVRRSVRGVSDQTIRLVLQELRDEQRIRADGTGRGAVWTRL